jgi:hypothetical protein
LLFILSFHEKAYNLMKAYHKGKRNKKGLKLAIALGEIIKPGL